MRLKSTLHLFIAAIVVFSIGGCAGTHPHGPGSISSEQFKNWNDAATKYNACTKARREQLVAYAPQWSQLVSGHSDPQFLQKMTSKEPLTEALKESLIKYRPQQVACRKVLFDNLGEGNPWVKIIYQKNFNALDEGIVKILDGKLNTIGELNQAYVAHNNEIAELRARLLASSQKN